MHACLSCTPNGGPGPQPRHVSWPGIKPAALTSTGQCSIHWATPARATIIILCLYLCPRHSSISRKAQEPLRPERQSDGLATSASWIDSIGIDIISDSSPENIDPPGIPGPTSPDSLAVARWIFMALHFSAFPAAVLGRASRLSPRKQEHK